MSTVRITLPEGRIVQGHPFERQQVTDERGNPRTDAQGNPMTQVFFSLAIPKGQETHWNQTPWGAKIDAQAKEPEHGWPNGEWQRPDFSWKIEDGDSTIPNKRGIAPNSREGFPGHWILKCSTYFDVPCFPQGNVTDDTKFTPTSKLSDPEGYPRRGDYFLVALDVKGNKPSQSPGIYLNPFATVLTRKGVEIVSDSQASASDVQALFGGDAPAPAPAPTTPPPAPGAMPPPAPELVEPPKAPTMWTYGGQTKPESEWLSAGWSLEQLQAHATKG